MKENHEQHIRDKIEHKDKGMLEGAPVILQKGNRVRFKYSNPGSHDESFEKYDPNKSYEIDEVFKDGTLRLKEFPETYTQDIYWEKVEE